MSITMPRKRKAPVSRTCPICSVDFMPSSSAPNRRYCTPDCSSEAERLATKRARYRVSGRTCRWCDRPDSITQFSPTSTNECSACARRAWKNGRCLCECPKVIGRYGRTIARTPHCPICSKEPAKPGRITIKLVIAGYGREYGYRKVTRHPTTVINIGGSSTNYRRVNKRVSGTPVFLVDDNDLMLGSSSRPLAVKGLWEPWPTGLRLLSDAMLSQFSECVHHLKIGTVTRFHPDWWCDAFRPGKSMDTARRAWERFKKTYRDIGVPGEIVYERDSPEAWAISDQPTARKPVLIPDRRQFITAVEREWDRRLRLKNMSVELTEEDLLV